MEKVWAVYINSNYVTALFPTAEMAYEYLLDRLSDNSLTEDPDESRYWEELAKDLTADYDRGDEEFSCDFCWAKMEKISQKKKLTF